MTRQRALVNFCACFYGVILFVSFFGILFTGQGWRRSEGTINYQYVAGGVPPTKQDVVSRSLHLPVYARLNSRALPTTPMCLSPASNGDAPSQWYTDRIVRNSPALANQTHTEAVSSQITSESLDFSSLFLYWESSESAWVISDGSRVRFKLPTVRRPDPSSVPSNSGWLRADLVKDAYHAMRNGQQYKIEYHFDSSFSIDFIHFNNSLVEFTSDNIPECYDYVLTQFPVDDTYWQSLTIVLMGFILVCYVLCCGPYEDLYCFAIFFRLFVVWISISVRRRFYNKQELFDDVPAKEEP